MSTYFSGHLYFGPGGMYSAWALGGHTDTHPIESNTIRPNPFTSRLPRFCFIVPRKTERHWFLVYTFSSLKRFQSHCKSIQLLGIHTRVSHGTLGAANHKTATACDLPSLVDRWVCADIIR
uniref:Uncharacterized protein n=1 Tax=Anopheles christyi TaxID=43041 RepID=A0A182KHQ6_9DIPT